jgi:methylated-DNA-[protein]-cysteine S-methyltransferase
MSVTPFQKRVYEAVSRIPKGRVATYQGVAKHIGCGSPRAVGQALRRNPFAPRVPCHRVIASTLAMGGFKGETGGPALRRKMTLLAGEGVRFVEGRLSEPSRVYRFGSPQ